MNPFNFLNTIYNVSQSSRLLELIRNPGTRFEEVLDEDVLLQDFRDNKQAVIE